MKTKSKFVISAGIIIAVIISTQYGKWSHFIQFNEDNSNGNNSEGTNNNSNSEVSPQSRTLRIGYFPNLNHAQAVIGLQQGGDFQKF